MRRYMYSRYCTVLRTVSGFISPESKPKSLLVSRSEAEIDSICSIMQNLRTQRSLDAIRWRPAMSADVRYVCTVPHSTVPYCTYLRTCSYITSGPRIIIDAHISPPCMTNYHQKTSRCGTNFVLADPQWFFPQDTPVSDTSKVRPFAISYLLRINRLLRGTTVLHTGSSENSARGLHARRGA